MTTNVHPNPATLTGQSVATWKFKCLKAGTFNLTYDPTAGTGTYLATKDGFEHPSDLENGTVECIAPTASVDGYIKLQGRLVTTRCRQPGRARCDADLRGGTLRRLWPYTMTTDATGYYQHAKTDLAQASCWAPTR